MARPKKPIDPKQVETLAAINCSVAEIAAVVDADRRTIQRRFATLLEKGRDTGKSSLKRKMWEIAMNGNVTMCIWLSKQMLGYTDKVEQKSEVQTKEKRVVELKWADEDDLAAQAPAQDTASTTDQPIN